MTLETLHTETISMVSEFQKLQESRQDDLYHMLDTCHDCHGCDKSLYGVRFFIDCIHCERISILQKIYIAYTIIRTAENRLQHKKE